MPVLPRGRPAVCNKNYSNTLSDNEQNIIASTDFKNVMVVSEYTSLFIMTSFVKLLTKLLGIVFILIGIAGFFVDGTLLVFEVDTMHNIVHLVSGIIALGASGNYKLARLYLIVFGFVYAAVAIVGFTTGSIAGLFRVNEADNILHIVIGGLSLLVGLGSKKTKN